MNADEIEAMRDIWNTLQPFDPWQQERIVAYFADRCEQLNVWGEKEGKSKRTKKVDEE